MAKIVLTTDRALFTDFSGSVNLVSLCWIICPEKQLMLWLPAGESV